MTKRTETDLIDHEGSNDSYHITDPDGTAHPFRAGERVAVLDAGVVEGGPYTLQPHEANYPRTVFVVMLDRLGRHYVDAGACRRIGPALGELLDKLRSASDRVRGAVADAALRLQANATLEPPGADDPFVQLVRGVAEQVRELDAPWVAPRERLLSALGWPAAGPLDRWIEFSLQRLAVAGIVRVDALEVIAAVLDGERRRLEEERIVELAEARFTGEEAAERRRLLEQLRALEKDERESRGTEVTAGSVGPRLAHLRRDIAELRRRLGLEEKSAGGEPIERARGTEQKATPCTTCRGTRRVFGGICPHCEDRV